MSFSRILLKHRTILAILAIVGFVSGYSWIKYRPEAWTFEVELVPASSTEIDELVRTVFVEHFKLPPKSYVTEEKISTKQVDALFRKLKYNLTSRTQRQKYLSEIPISDVRCATEAIGSIKIFQLDTQVPLYPSYRISVTATCPAVNTYLEGFVDTLKTTIFSEVVGTELARLRDEAIRNYSNKRQLLEQLKGLSREFADEAQVTLLQFADEDVPGAKAYEYTYTIDGKLVIDKIDRELQQLDAEVEKLLASGEGVTKPPRVAWDANWIIQSSAVFSSSNDTNLRLSLLYGFGLSSLLVMGFTILLTIKEEFSETNRV